MVAVIEREAGVHEYSKQDQQYTKDCLFLPGKRQDEQRDEYGSRSQGQQS